MDTRLASRGCVLTRATHTQHLSTLTLAHTCMTFTS